ncbi:DUF4194 domain-containing protein [Variovorax paradoxus]|uniref:DUF4194 domain-containing protein n=1 Tax=Variovorax paradoxus TaxID=34073 RepID=UPI002783DF1A|nr:DUF4194 domain-containing protein [Variovorax paradoxus]MDP9933486.1 hypothetical protein [Variovorax paradoxus]
MPKNWNAVADRSDGLYTVDMCKQALHQLLTQQCLYRRFLHQVTAYRLISANRPEFEEAVELSGCRLYFKDHREFCCIVPDVAKPTLLDLQQTVFLLVLRRLYHEHGSVGDLTPDGDAIVTATELTATYMEMCGKPLEKGRGDVMALIKMAWSNGLAKEADTADDDPQPFAVAILPGIAEVLSEQAVGRFGASLKAALAVSGIAPDEKEVTEEDVQQ